MKTLASRPASRALVALLALTAVLAAAGTAVLLTVQTALAAGPAAALPEGAGWAFAAAAAATALSSLAAGYAVAKVGTAAIGALAEKPELFGRLLIFVGLAEGIAIYGLIVSILILNRLA
ncbi:MAG: ATP synthase subunit C [Burkholderiaceae bacterium]